MLPIFLKRARGHSPVCTSDSRLIISYDGISVEQESNLHTNGTLRIQPSQPSTQEGAGQSRGLGGGQTPLGTPSPRGISYSHVSGPQFLGTSSPGRWLLRPCPRGRDPELF